MRQGLCSALACSASLLVVGCTSSTKVTGPDSDALSAAHSEPIQLIELNDPPLQEQVSFLGRYLLSDDYRASVTKNVVASDWGQQAMVQITEDPPIGSSTVTGMAASQVATGDLLSKEGSAAAFKTTLAVDLVNSILATQQRSDVSGFLMPARFGDIDVESAEQATELAVAFTESRIRSAVEASGYELACYVQCERDSQNRVYRLTRVRDRPGMFAPAELYLYWGYLPLVEMPAQSEEHLLTPLLGFVPKYTSKPANTWTIYLGTKLTTYGREGKQAVERHSRLVTTPLSREIRRALYAGQRNMYWGSRVAESRSAAFYVKDEKPALIYFDSEIYAIPDSIGKIFGAKGARPVTHTVQ